MYKTIFLVLAAVAVASATPGPKPGVFAAYTAPAVVTAQSSQVVARNYNGLVAPIVAAAPLVRAAPFVAAPHYNPYIAAPYVAAPYAYY